jgi:hypothetical protein
MATLTVIVWIVAAFLYINFMNFIQKNFTVDNDTVNLIIISLVSIPIIISSTIYYDMYGTSGMFEVKWWLIGGFIALCMYSILSIILPSILHKRITIPRGNAQEKIFLSLELLGAIGSIIGIIDFCLEHF